MRKYTREKKSILYSNNEQYFKIMIREKRHGTLLYFKEVNKFQIQARDIDEKKLFNSSDLYYIRKLQGI